MTICQFIFGRIPCFKIRVRNYDQFHNQLSQEKLWREILNLCLDQFSIFALSISNLSTNFREIKFKFFGMENKLPSNLGYCLELVSSLLIHYLKLVYEGFEFFTLQII